ncbi:MAG: hypothetical protein WD601_07890, partial [Pseudohongiellaceae bacterium]
MTLFECIETNNRSTGKWVITAAVLMTILLPGCLDTTTESDVDTETDPGDSTPEPTPDSDHSRHHPTDKNWRLVWSDEFDGSAIDPAKWSHEQNCWGGGNNEQQCYTDQASNAFIENGTLVIKAIKEDFTGP